MLTVYACLTQEHDYRLVLLAAFVCLLSAAMTVKLLRRVRNTEDARRLPSTLAAAVVSGIGVWATHFIAMLAFTPGMPVGYDLPITLASLAAAVLLIGAGFWVAVTRIAWLGGGLAGVGVGVMHYLGMAAFQAEGRLVWDMGLVASSILIGGTLAAGALPLALSTGRPWRQWVSAGLLTLAICGLHFTAMGAATLVPDSTMTVARSTLPSGWLAMWVAMAALALLVLSAGALVMEQAQREAERRRRQELADVAVEGLVVCRDGVIISVNASFAALAGASEAELEGVVLASLLDAAAVGRLEGESDRFEALLQVAGGAPTPVELIVRSLTFDGRPHHGVAVRDLRERHLADAQIRFLAHHDSLTGLDNRASFNERLARELERHRRKDDGFAVLCMDLDRFKPINDVFGHAAGDMVLKAVAQRVAAELGPDDVFARLGGDEFAILCLGDSRPTALADLSQRILAALAHEIDLEGSHALVGSSIGIALYPGDGEAAAPLLRNADAALYCAKAAGRGCFRFFEPSIGADLLHRQSLEFDLRVAIGRGELSLAYQPQTSTVTGETFGFEALLRWRHPVRGFVPPSEFIPIAEETGLILPIGEWVLRQACLEAASWPRPLNIAVNLSGVQMRAPTLPAVVAAVLAESGLAPSRLELEITETTLVADFDQSLRMLTEIKALGVRVAMDDFGTGYSSLSNLRAFPFDKIKIDQSFVRDVHANDQAATIVRAILGLAKGLNLTVLAEGVETLDELAFLNAEMCTEAQGYFFGRPGEMSEFAHLIAAPKPRRKAG
jgi:diguanylate cyclase